MPNIVWTKKAIKQLIKIDTRYQSSIKDKKYRLRVKDYRVIFEWQDDQEPHIISVEKVLKRDNRTYRHN